MTNEAQTASGRKAGGQVIRELALYFALAFGITWSLGAAMIFARPQLEAVVGPIRHTNTHWLYYLAVCAPTISAIVCSLAFGGFAGLKSLAMRFVRPAHPLWFIGPILIWPALIAALAVVENLLGLKVGIDLHALVMTAPLIAVTTPALIVDPGGLGEETGWRGFALPRLLTLLPPVVAAVVLGLIWGIWHLPAFFVSDLVQSQFGLAWFLAGGISLTVVMTWLYQQANGNLLVAGVFPHLIWNLMFDAHVFLRAPVEQETTVIGLLALTLILVSGPSLKGWGKR